MPACILAAILFRLLLGIRVGNLLTICGPLLISGKLRVRVVISMGELNVDLRETFKLSCLWAVRLKSTLF